VRLLSAILDAAGAEGDVREGIWSALAERDYVLYGELVSSLKNIAEGSQNGLGSIFLSVFSTCSLQRRRSMRSGAAGVSDAATGLISILEALEDRGLGKHFRLDLSIVREFRYYTGVCLRVMPLDAGTLSSAGTI